MRKDENRPEEVYFDKAEEESRPVYPESAAEDEKPPMPDPRIFMCVYAGPEYFSRRNPSGGMFRPDGESDLGLKMAAPPETPPEEPDAALRFCPICGVKVRPGQKFCHECGSPIALPQPEPQEQRQSEEANREDAGDEINDTSKSGEFGGSYGAEISGAGSGSVNV